MGTGLKCPKCEEPLTRGETQCPCCGATLKWLNPLKKEEPREEASRAAPQSETPTPPSRPKFCPECGTKLAPEQKFCPECGTPIAGAAPESAGTAPAPAPQAADERKPGTIVLGPRDCRRIKAAIRSSRSSAASELYLSRALEGQAAASSLNWAAFSGEFFVLIALACFWPEIWFFLAAFAIAEFAAASMRSDARKLLEEHRVDEVRPTLESAKKWHRIAIIAFGAALVDVPIRFICLS